MYRILSSFSLFALASAPTLALAEGGDSLPVVEQLLPETDLYVDIINPAIEVIQYRGDRPADVFDPAGNFVETLFDGGVVQPSVAGAYRFDIDRLAAVWDLEVPGRVGGRLWSPDWRFDAGTFERRDSLTRSFYALVDGGQDGHDSVVELKAEGFAGYVFRLAANRAGLQGANGRSVPVEGQRYDAKIPIYFEPPEIARLNPLAPTITNLTALADFGLCQTVVPGSNSATISFESSVRGTAHLICDLNGDGVYDMVDDGDLHIIQKVEQGSNTILWEGETNDGERVADGTYTCIVRLTLGEFHYVAYDVETSFPGLRFFEYQGNGTRESLNAYWNDTEVQGLDVNMPNGVPSSVSSGAFGLPAGAYANPATPGGNARSWGSFRQGGKGDETWLDTYTWLANADSAAFSLQVQDGAADTDGDALADYYETCTSLTDPLKADTDEDGLDDGREHLNIKTDPLNPDTDGDCMLDGEEVPSGQRAPDSDGDGTADPFDNDDDNDTILTALEMCGAEFLLVLCDEETTGLLPDPVRDFRNIDGDRWPNHLDNDSDDDFYRDSTEGIGDGDGDLLPDFIDDDAIGSGLDCPADGFYSGGCAVQSGGRLGSALGLLVVPLVLRRRRRS